jgi:DNA-binding GntR family transcriptional regulator
MPKTKKRGASLREAAGSLSEHAYLAIRNGILRGDFPLGTPLSRRKLAAELGMSHLPVSAALQRLENEGLVESRPRVGTRVKIPSQQDIRGLFIVREALYSQAARIFAEKASPAERREIRALAAELDSLWAKIAQSSDEPRDKDRMFELNQLHMRFHMRVVECTGCAGLWEAVERNHIPVFHWLYDLSLASPVMPMHWHSNLAEQLIQEDPEKADAAMRMHVRYGLDEMLQHLEPFSSLDSFGFRGLALAGPVTGMRNSAPASNLHAKAHPSAQ